MTRAAIMQPYIFPYLGYFQLIQSVDKFVFYDDVNFIKRGWVNRNRILVNGEAKRFTVPVESASSFELIKNTKIHLEKYEKWKKSFFKTFFFNYKKARNFEDVNQVVKNVLEAPGETIDSLARKSILATLNYLGIERSFYLSSANFSQTKSLDRADRLVAINQKLGAEIYVNMLGGKQLYEKSYFSASGIELKFLKPQIMAYKQPKKEFVPNLSIIDLMMHEKPEKIRQMMKHYTLE